MDLTEFEIELMDCIEHLKEDLSQIRTGRATPEILFGLRVDAYDTMNPIKNVASINVSDAKSLLVQPWDKSIIQNVYKAILSSDLGISPSVEGDYIRVHIPDLTEERRKDFVKVMKDRVESARVSVRSVRQKYMKDVDEAVKNGMPEDDGKRLREEIEKKVKTANEDIEALRKEKENDLMSI